MQLDAESRMGTPWFFDKCVEAAEKAGDGQMACAEMCVSARKQRAGIRFFGKWPKSAEVKGRKGVTLD